jgi:type VI secretion system protein ImpJ
LERASNPAVAARAPQLLETRSMIASLTAALPPFEALLDTGRAHPFALYLALCALVGQVSGLGRALLPPALAPYDHEDLNPRFEAARKFLVDLVDGAVLESYTPFPFELDGGTFSLAFDAAWRSRALVLGVRAPEGASESEVAAWMDDAVIASRDRQRELRILRVLGAERRRIKGEGDLLPAPGVLLYALTAEPKNVEANQLLQIANPDEGLAARRPLEIVLYVKNRP